MKISTIIANLVANEIIPINSTFEYEGKDVPTITSKDVTYYSYVCLDTDYLNLYSGWYPYHVFYDSIRNIDNVRLLHYHYTDNKELLSSKIELTDDGLVLELEFNVVKATNIKLYYSIFYSLIQTFMKKHKLIKVIFTIHKLC